MRRSPAKALPQRREYTGDAGADRSQQAREDVVALLRSSPFIRGRLFSVQLVAGTAKTIRHRLGVPAAFFAIRPNYDGTGTQTRLPIESATAFQSTLDQKNELSIVCGDSGKWDLWFYPRASRAIDARTGVSA